MIKLSDKEKQHIMDMISNACKGTPLQPHSDFVGGYIGNLVISQIECWDEIKKALNDEPSNS